MQQKQHFDAGYLLLACLAVADIPQEVLRSTIYKTFEGMLSSLEVCLENANLLNEMVKMWVVIVDKLKQGDDNAEILHFIGNSPKMLTLIELIYEMHADNVFICLNPELFELNLLKYEAAERTRPPTQSINASSSRPTPTPPTSTNAPSNRPRRTCHESASHCYSWRSTPTNSRRPAPKTSPPASSPSTNSISPCATSSSTSSPPPSSSTW